MGSGELPDPGTQLAPQRCSDFIYIRLLHKGDSEELIGKWFARTGNRSKIFLATKFGIDHSPSNPSGIRGDREYARDTLNTSLKKLQTDYVDLLYQHRSDPKTPVEVTVRAMKELVE